MNIYGAYAIVTGIAAVATYLLVIPVRRLALRYRLTDHPGTHHIHERPTAAIGGVAMFFAFAVAMGVAWRMPIFGHVFQFSSEPLGVVLGAAVICAVGIVDDLRDISAPAKVAGQVLAAMVLVLLGVTMDFFKIPFVGAPYILSPSILPLITALWVVGMANAVNLIDGLDGLAAGIVAIAAAVLCIYSLRLVALGDLDVTSVGPLVAALTCGVCLGFLPHNFHPARIFMGDGGALLLGLLMAAATMVIGGRTESDITAGPSDVSGLTFFRFAPLFIPVFILGVPLLDTAFAIVRRTVRRSGVATRDLGHLHHRLIRLGHGHRRAVLILWAWTAVLSAFVLLPTFAPSTNVYVPFGAGFLALALLTVLRPGTGSVPAVASDVSGPLEVEVARVRAQGSGDPITVVRSGSAGVAVAGEPDLTGPARRRRGRGRVPRLGPLRRRSDRAAGDGSPATASAELPRRGER